MQSIAAKTTAKVTTQGNETTPKKSINNLLKVDVGPETALLGSCIPDACLRIDNVSSITGLSVSTIYREIAEGRFPLPVKITTGARAWKLSEVMEWIDTRERDSRSNADRVQPGSK